MTAILRFPLIDGPLIHVPSAERFETVQRMADALLTDHAMHDKRDAVSCLLRRGFHSLKVALLVADAMALAFQDLVAKEMSIDG